MFAVKPSAARPELPKGFDAWLQGEPLDIGAILHTPEGKPRAAIFSIAHLDDHERMFFVSLLLNQMLGWVRSQSGTTSHTTAPMTARTRPSSRRWNQFASVARARRAHEIG